MRAARAFLLLVSLSAFGQTAPFPAGTQQFFNTRVYDAVPAAGGGVWTAAPNGIVRYTAAGAGTTLTVPGTRPYLLELAADGSIWFVTPTTIGRISPSGVIHEQYPFTHVRNIAVGTDGALWYLRFDQIGRIAGGTLTQRPAPTEAWNLAAAPSGEVWILPTGFASANDHVYRMTVAGALTSIPVGDILFGDLQSMPEGTLYISGGIRPRVLRLTPAAQAPQFVAATTGSGLFVEPDGDIWTGGYSRLGYIAAGGSPQFSVEMPDDPRLTCVNVPAYLYQPLVVDGEGSLWLAIHAEYGGIATPPPCFEPAPPPMPDLIRINAAQLVVQNAPTVVPALSPATLFALAMALAAAAIFAIRG